MVNQRRTCWSFVHPFVCTISSFDELYRNQPRIASSEYHDTHVHVTKFVSSLLSVTWQMSTNDRSCWCHETHFHVTKFVLCRNLRCSCETRTIVRAMSKHWWLKCVSTYFKCLVGWHESLADLRTVHVTKFGFRLALRFIFFRIIWQMWNHDRFIYYDTHVHVTKFVSCLRCRKCG